MSDELDDLPDADLRLRALPLMGWRRYRYKAEPFAFIDHVDPDRKVCPYDPGLPGGGQSECGDEVPLYPDGIRRGTPDPATDVGDAMALVEAVMRSRRRERLELEPPRADGDGWEARFTYYDCDGRNAEEYATAPTLPRALTILSLRVPRI